jgi:hypothetical protein
MRFRSVTILGNRFGARRIRATARLVSIILINAISVNAQVEPPGHAGPSPRPKAITSPELSPRKFTGEREKTRLAASKNQRPEFSSRRFTGKEGDLAP